MLIDFKTDAERHAHLEGRDYQFREFLDLWEDIPTEVYQMVCRWTAESAVRQYWQKLQDKEFRKWKEQG